MQKPPGPKQRTYRGRIRNDIRSTYNHMNKLLHWDSVYRSGPINSYPNQLLSAAQQNTLANAATILLNMLVSTGPIPSR